MSLYRIFLRRTRPRVRRTHNAVVTERPLAHTLVCAGCEAEARSIAERQNAGWSIEQVVAFRGWSTHL